MINLLPPEVKQGYLYARRNTQLVHWLIGLTLGIVGIVIIIMVGTLYINRSISSYNQQIAQGQERLKVHKLEDSQKQVQDITNNLKLVIQVLSKEVMFSKMIQKIGGAMPPGSVLTSLEINKTQGGIDLGARATNYQTATQIQVNLSDPNNLVFEKADINQLRCGEQIIGTTALTSSPETRLISRYPCEIKIRALFGPNNPYLFINNSVTTSGSGGQR